METKSVPLDPNDPRTQAVPPGWQSSEFWLSLWAFVLAAVAASGLIPEESTWGRVVAVGLAVLAALGYTAGRSLVKRESVRAAADIAIMEADRETVVLQKRPEGGFVRLPLLASLAGLLLLSPLAGCAGGGVHYGERSLVGFQLFHWRACLAEEAPIAGSALCEEGYQVLRGLEDEAREQHGDRWAVLARVWLELRPYLGRALDRALDWLFGARPPEMAEAFSVTPRPVLSLRLVRAWRRPAGPGQRTRLAAGPDGQLLVAWTQKCPGRRLCAVLEDQSGRALEQRSVETPIPEFHPALIVAGQLLIRDRGQLLLGGVPVAAGAWEAYAGLPEAVLAWQPCARRPCPASVLYEAPAGWQGNPWAVELFGVDLAPAASGTVAVATRENPNSSGWTLRIVDRSSLGRGVLAEMEPRQYWRLTKGLSLEDALLVRGAPVPTVIGTAYQNPGHGTPEGPTGRVFLAEQGRELRELGRVKADAANAEIGAAVHEGTLYVAAQVDPGLSELLRWVDRVGFVQVGQVEGGAPSLAAAGGRLWLSTTAGLWRLE